MTYVCTYFTCYLQVRDIYRWHGAKGLGYVQHGLLNEKAKTALARNKQDRDVWRGIANVGRGR